jgi:heat shock protein HslJ
MPRKQLKLAGIVAAIIVGVGLVAAGAMGAGLGPVSDQEPADAPATPTETTTAADDADTETPGNLAGDVEVFPRPSVGDETITIGSGADGPTNYTLTNNASESQRVTIIAGTEDGPSRQQNYELKPGDSVTVSFSGSANYWLIVKVNGGATGTYDVTVDCNQRFTTLEITPTGEIKQGPTASTRMACGPFTETA